ncbi:MAG TPA: hypothetical protein GX510_02910 [Firmicutes bacterium]|nr:hypothetical protein [Candidatus Fermentithermobacillaceae bacterium]
MAVFLDIDADFMFKPRTSGNTLIKQRLWIRPEDLLKNLKAAGLKWKGSPVALFTDHKEAYFVWKEWGAHSDTLIHVDAHSDLYDTFSWSLHCGNYLRRALEERMFSKVVWVMPDWLPGSGEWTKWDIPFFGGESYEVRVRRSRAPECNAVLRGEENVVGTADGHPGRFEAGRGIAVRRRKVRFQAVPLGYFNMPNSTVALTTLATSPTFVPAGELGSVRELVERIARDASCVEVRPNIPLSLRDPRLRELLRADLVQAGSPELLRLRTGRTSGGWRAAAGFLWAEHRAMARGDVSILQEGSRKPGIQGRLKMENRIG